MKLSSNIWNKKNIINKDLCYGSERNLIAFHIKQ